MWYCKQKRKFYHKFTKMCSVKLIDGFVVKVNNQSYKKQLEPLKCSFKKCLVYINKMY